MDFILGLTQIIGVHTILGLSAYVVLQTGQVSMAQAGFFSIGLPGRSVPSRERSLPGRGMRRGESDLRSTRRRRTNTRR